MTPKQEIAALKRQIRGLEQQLRGFEDDRLRLNMIQAKGAWLTCAPKAWAGKWRCGTEKAFPKWCYGETAREAIDSWMDEFCR